MAGGPITRRDFVKTSALVAAGIAAAGAGTLVIRSAMGPDPHGTAPVLVATTQEPVQAGMLPESGSAPLAAIWDGQPAIVAVVPKTRLAASGQARGYNTAQHAVAHPTDDDAVVLAYDARCTHLGCTVGWAPELGASLDIADYDDDGAPDGRALCPCHQAQFDLYDLGRDQQPGPAPRPLAVVRIRFERPRDGPSSRSDWVLIGLERIEQEVYRAADRDGAPAR